MLLSEWYRVRAKDVDLYLDYYIITFIDNPNNIPTSLLNVHMENNINNSVWKFLWR